MRVRVSKALGGVHRELFFFPGKKVQFDLQLAMNEMFPYFVGILKQFKKRLPRIKALKFQIRIQIQLEKYSFDLGEKIVKEPWFISETCSVLNLNSIVKAVKSALLICERHFENFVQAGSGWVLKRVQRFSLLIMRYKLLTGGCSLYKLPPFLKKSRALISLKNFEENKCFIYAVCAGILKEKRNSFRVSKKAKKLASLFPNESINFPVTLREVLKVENLMPMLSINIYGFDKVLFPYYVTDKINRKYHVDLLLYENHYFPIKNLSALLTDRKNRRKTYVCKYCLSSFVNYSRYKMHFSLCTRDCQQISMPGEDEAFLKFKLFKTIVPVPFIIYADLETAISPENFNVGGKATSKRDHRPIAAAAYTVCSANEFYSQSQPSLFIGYDCISKLFAHLGQEFSRISHVLATVHFPLQMTRDDWSKFNQQSFCQMCKISFKLPHVAKVRDHCHLTGKYRFALCMTCNLIFAKTQFDVPIFFHGLNNYDQHFIIPQLTTFLKCSRQPNIRIIPKNNQKFLSFSIDNLAFKDSHEFLAGSLAQLVSDLKTKGVDNFFHVNKIFLSEELRNYLYRKGVFPYNYISDISVLQEGALPPIEEFYNDLSKKSVSQADYNFACQVWRAFKCQTLKDYLVVYLLADVLLLADVFENFRKTSIQNYVLDPAHFVSNAQYTWQSYLRFSGAKLELLTDINKYFFLIRGVRGGVSMVGKRYSVANNKDMPTFKSAEPSTYILYVDCNNLYGKAMCDYLPFRNFRWMTKADFDLNKILSTSADSSEGYILECTLFYPKSLHSSHSDLPLAPEKISIPFEHLSPIAKNMCLKNNLKASTNSEKLSCTFYDKFRYVLHYRNLQLYLQLGLELKKVHRVLVFEQAPVLKKYIEWNTQKRATSTNDFDSNYFKLMSNSLFGKTMERPDKRTKVNLVSKIEKYEKIVSNLNFKNAVCINKNLISLESKYSKIKIDKPFYLGMCILDISKCYMFNFHYNVMLNYFQPKKLRLLYTDTDSFIYEIHTDDLYQDLAELREHFDFSNYPKAHPLYSGDNKKIPGFFKDECAGKMISAFVGLRAKMYALQILDEQTKCFAEMKAAKGVSRSVVSSDLKFQNYVDCILSSEQQEFSFSSIQSKDHHVFTGKQFKISLSPFDDKRYLISNVDSLPYGHEEISAELEGADD